jgi:hypothetical protein
VVEPEYPHSARNHMSLLLCLRSHGPAERTVDLQPAHGSVSCWRPQASTLNCRFRRRTDCLLVLFVPTRSARSPSVMLVHGYRSVSECAQHGSPLLQATPGPINFTPTNLVRGPRRMHLLSCYCQPRRAHRLCQIQHWPRYLRPVLSGPALMRHPEQCKFRLAACANAAVPDRQPWEIAALQPVP